MNPRLPLSLALVTLAAALPAAAVDQIWTGATDGLWTNANWNAALPGTADVAVFDNTSIANLATTLGADQSIAGIRIADPTGAVSVAATNILTLGASGIDMSAATQNFTFNNAVVLGATQIWNVGAGRTLFGGTGTTTGVVSGAFGITKQGSGILTLQGTNTFTGGINVTSGTLTVKNSTGAGTGTISLSNGTTFRTERNGNAGIFPSNGVSVASAASVIMTTDQP